MDEPLIVRENEPSEPAYYPRNRFITLFTILICLLLLMTAGERYLGLKESKSTDGIDSAISGDIQVKAAYSQMYLSEKISAESKKHGLDYSDTSSAIRDYRESVILSPIPGNIRKLIILDNSRLRQKTILSLDKLRNNKNVRKSTRANIPNEIDMWRDIYFSEGKSEPEKVAKYSIMISDMKLGWYEHLALADLYQSKGGKAGEADASRERSLAASKAFRSMSLIGLLAIIIILSGITGLILLILYINRISRRRFRKETIPQFQFRDIPGYEKSFVSGYMLESFIAYILISLVVQAGIAGLIALFTPRNFEMTGLASNIVGLASYLIAGVWSLVYLSVKIHRGGWDWNIIGLNRRSIGRDIAWGMYGYAAALPLLLIMVFITTYIEKIIPTPPNPAIPEILTSTDVVSRIMLFLMIAIGAPVFEEIFFRGVLMSSLRARWGAFISIFVSSAIFAVLHPFPGSFMPIFMLGAIFATLAYERSSLIPGIVTHCMNNTLIFIILILTTG